MDEKRGDATQSKDEQDATEQDVGILETHLIQPLVEGVADAKVYCVTAAASEHDGRSCTVRQILADPHAGQGGDGAESAVVQGVRSVHADPGVRCWVTRNGTVDNQSGKAEQAGEDEAREKMLVSSDVAVAAGQEAGDGLEGERADSEGGEGTDCAAQLDGANSGAGEVPRLHLETSRVVNAEDDEAGEEHAVEGEDPEHRWLEQARGDLEVGVEEVADAVGLRAR